VTFRVSPKFLFPSLSMSSAHKFLPHYTVADYQNWDGDWELWQGIPVSMSPSPFGTHQRIAKNLVFELESQVREHECSANVLYEIDWIVADDTVVRPDVIVVCGDPPERHVESPPALIAEILSSSTARRDREAKRDLYHEQGVGAYLLVDPESQSVELFRRDTRPEWRADRVTDARQLSVCDGRQLTIRHADMFR